VRLKINQITMKVFKPIRYLS